MSSGRWAKKFWKIEESWETKGRSRKAGNVRSTNDNVLWYDAKPLRVKENQLFKRSEAKCKNHKHPDTQQKKCNRNVANLTWYPNALRSNTLWPRISLVSRSLNWMMIAALPRSLWYAISASCAWALDAARSCLQNRVYSSFNGQIVIILDKWSK